MARVSIVLLQVFAYGYLACSASTEEDTWLETYSESTAAQASGFASTQHWRSQDPALGCYQSDTPFGSMTLTRLRSCPTRTAGQDPQQWVTDCLETFRYGPPTPPVEPGPCTAQDVGGGLALDPATALTLHTPAQGDMPSNTLLYFVKQTASPTEAPSISPTFAPSDAPTQAPTQVPTQVPTPSPTTQGGAIQDLRESVNAVMVGTGSQIAALGRQLYGLSMDVNQEEARLRAELTAAVDTQAKANAQVNDSLGRSSTKISKLTDQLAASEIKIAAVGTKVAANKQLQEQMMSMLKNKTQQLGESLQAKITTVSQALDSATTQGQGEISELKSQLKAAAQTQQQNLAALQANVTREAEKHKAAIDALSTKVDAASTSTADKIAKLKATLEGQIGVVDGRLSSFQKNEGSVNQQLTSEVSALQDKFTGEFKEQAAVNKEQAAVNKEQAAVNKEQAAVNKEQAQEISNQANQIKQLNISLKEQISDVWTGLSVAPSTAPTPAPTPAPACASGYKLQIGDVPGWGRVGGVGGGVSVESCEGCAKLCDDKMSDGCRSYECSPTELRCNLNNVENPTQPNYKDYNFCSRS